MIKKFFECLADYARKENDISDITVALCKANPTFKETFVKFFFNNIDINEIKKIKREISSNDGQSRVDIMIEVEGDDKPYLIEVKKYDENHHFDQYVKAYNIPPERLGYITNYELKKEGGYQIKKWSEFYKVLTNEDEKNKKAKNDELIQAYAQYLNKVCEIVYNKRIDLTKIESDDNFFRIVRDIVSTSIVVTDYDTKYDNEYAYGYHFANPGETINKENGGYFVLLFETGQNPEVSIYVISRKRLQQNILSMIRNDGKYYIAPYEESHFKQDDAIKIQLNKLYLNKILTSKTYDEQLDVLKSFYEEVVKSIKHLI